MFAIDAVMRRQQAECLGRGKFALVWSFLALLTQLITRNFASLLFGRSLCGCGTRTLLHGDERPSVDSTLNGRSWLRIADAALGATGARSS